MFTLFTAHTSISCTNVYISKLILISASDTRHQTNTDTLLSCFTNAQDHKQLFLLLSEQKKDYIQYLVIRKNVVIVTVSVNLQSCAIGSQLSPHNSPTQCPVACCSVLPAGCCAAATAESSASSQQTAAVFSSQMARRCWSYVGFIASSSIIHIVRCVI